VFEERKREMPDAVKVIFTAGFACRPSSVSA
jgi:hypothetical protein